MNLKIMYSIVISITVLSTIFAYVITQGMGILHYVLTATFPILALITFVPLQRIINQIYKTLEKQNGKCYNCNLTITDKGLATLEDDKHVYCRSCDHAIFGEPIVRDGIEYRNDKKDKDKK